MRQNFLFTSESVSEGHPDKICDQISDALVDKYISLDKFARTAIETFATTNNIIIGGEIRAPKIEKDEFESIIRGVVKDIGYEQERFHWEKLQITNFLHEQSPDIARGVDSSENKEEGAGDQGIMFGFACNETNELMPAPIFYSHAILKNLAEKIKIDQIKLGPDAKTQVTLKYENGIPVKAETIVLSIQHAEYESITTIKDYVIPVIVESLPQGWVDETTKLLINPTGKFVIGGPDGDAGLTGRKIIVDTYGGAAPHGGGAFSGKDPTKVDRSSAYMARYLAKNIVAANITNKCTIQLSYAIGVSKPLSLYVDDHQDNLLSEKLAEIINKLVDLSPAGIRHHLDLNKPIYRKTATYGHFGRTPLDDGSFSWERLDLIDRIKNSF